MTEFCKRCEQSVRTARSLRVGVCRACREEGERAQRRLVTKRAIQGLLARDDVLILDTETTGAGHGAEVIEVSVIDTRGAVRLDTLVKPKVQTDEPLCRAPSRHLFRDPTGRPHLARSLARTQPGFGPEHGYWPGTPPSIETMLERTSEVWGLHHPKWLFVCAMRLYAKGRGIRNRGLHKCVVDEGLEDLLEIHPSHRALGDVMFVLEVLRATTRTPIKTSLPEHA